MSNEAQGLVRNLALDAPHKPILMAYANYSDEAGYCFPGVETIAFDTGYSVPTVVRTRRQLVNDNWVRSKRQFGTSATTRLNLPKIAAAGVDRGDRRKIRPEFEFNDESAGQHRTDHTDLNSQISVISTRDHTDHLSIRDTSVDPSVETIEERAKDETASQNKTAEPAEWTLRLLADLNFGRFRRPTVKRARSMAHKIEAAAASGLTEPEIRRHCRAALNEATTNGAAYLDGALDTDHLPLPASTGVAPSPKSDAPPASAPETNSEERLGHEQAREHIEQVIRAKRRRARV